MPDGLGLLDQQRERRGRSIPTPKNPPRNTLVDVVEMTPRPTNPDDHDHGKQPVAPVSSAAKEPTIKMSIYLEPADDLYLENITHTGKTSRRRVAISRSAIVRLALQRLAETMTNDEIVNELRKTGTHHQGKVRCLGDPGQWPQ